MQRPMVSGVAECLHCFLHIFFLNMLNTQKIGNLPVAKLLIENGAKVNITDKDGNTPIMLALSLGKSILIIFNKIHIKHTREKRLCDFSF